MPDTIGIFAVAVIASAAYLIPSLVALVLMAVFLNEERFNKALKFWHDRLSPVFFTALVLWMGSMIIIVSLNAAKDMPNYVYPQNATDAAAVCMVENKTPSKPRSPGSFDAAGFIACMQGRGYQFIKDGVEVTPEQGTASE